MAREILAIGNNGLYAHFSVIVRIQTEINAIIENLPHLVKDDNNLNFYPVDFVTVIEKIFAFQDLIEPNTWNV